MDLQSLTKQQVLDIITTKTSFTSEEVKTIVSTMKNDKIGSKVSFLKIGDIVSTLAHPGVIIKIKADKVFALLITTNETFAGVSDKCESRLMPVSYFTNTVNVLTKEDALKKFICIYDNIPQVRRVTKKVKEFYKEL